VGDINVASYYVKNTLCGFEFQASGSVHMGCGARLSWRPAAGRRRRRRYGRGLFNKTTITPDIVMYDIARRDLSTTQRLPVPLYGDRISMQSRDPPPISQCVRATCSLATPVAERKYTSFLADTE